MQITVDDDNCTATFVRDGEGFLLHVRNRPSGVVERRLINMNTAPTWYKTLVLLEDSVRTWAIV